MIPRSHLYVSGADEHRLAGVRGRGADAVIVDLEDAVAPGARPAARALVRDWLRAQEPGRDELWVRVNPGDEGALDVAAVVGPGLAGVILAKAETTEDLTRLDDALTRAEAGAGIPTGSTRVVPLVESAAAVLAAPALAAGPRVSRLQLGEADLAADLGLHPGPDGQEFAAIRSHVVLVSAAAGIDPPVAPVSTDFRDLDALRAGTEALRRSGFVGRACIHPAQVAVVNEVFTPSSADLTWARGVVDAYAAVTGEGSGAGSAVVTGPDGRMIDRAVVRRADRLLALARPSG